MGARVALLRCSIIQWAISLKNFRGTKIIKLLMSGHALVILFRERTNYETKIFSKLAFNLSYCNSSLVYSVFFSMGNYLSCDNLKLEMEHHFHLPGHGLPLF